MCCRQGVRCQLHESLITLSTPKQDTVVGKAVRGHWRRQNEANILRQFQDRTPFLRPLIDQITQPEDPPAIVLKHLDSDLLTHSKSQKLDSNTIKRVSYRVLKALEVLHNDGYVHTGKLETDLCTRVWH